MCKPQASSFRECLWFLQRLPTRGRLCHQPCRLCGLLYGWHVTLSLIYSFQLQLNVQHLLFDGDLRTLLSLQRELHGVLASMDGQRYQPLRVFGAHGVRACLLSSLWTLQWRSLARVFGRGVSRRGQPCLLPTTYRTSQRYLPVWRVDAGHTRWRGSHRVRTNQQHGLDMVDDSRFLVPCKKWCRP